MLEDAHPGVFTKTVSHTTRRPRPNEIEGKNYFYIAESEFKTLILQDAFAEYTQFSGNYYGTSKATISRQMEKSLVVILEIDIEGVKQMRQKSVIDARFIFIKPPSFEELGTRLQKRSTETEQSIKRRMQQAEAELQQAENAGLYDRIIVNEELAKAFKELTEFVYEWVSEEIENY
ncbi:hypothetical protein NLG97_g9257 [Lecanicillium saksenae]|uniref:Uncharacterized protein n=1 Tax=Lecanicillium saksenae TaxID=468837 RepID=A0ACC1QID2_9HYPO|nr:hypothetical protein NLG97_g9257 [Lecanicillium saksenae]